MKSLSLIAAFGLLLTLSTCQQATSDTAESTTTTEESWEKPRVPDWHKNATIYEVNLRHYTAEGTFAAFQDHLPRLKSMGVDILWFMPIHPISEENRKGELGSPYAVDDYYKTNPDFGTMEEFKQLLSAIHDQGMHCIIDWVPNHTGWGNPWIEAHPDWYTKNAAGEITDPINYETGESWGWTDVADLDYNNPDMRLGMIEAMKFWITDVGVDGFRVDVAHGVPVDFWAQASDSLYAVEPIFMLAEAEVPAIVNNGAFVMDYAWEMHHLLNQIAAYQGANRDQAAKLEKGNVVEAGDEHAAEKKTALHIDTLLQKYATEYSQGYKMQFTSNHDENSWAGTEFARMGAGYEAFAVLAATFDGMPLLYTGMESGIDEQYPFFTKDTLDWGDFKYQDFYTKLFTLKHKNQALWNGTYGGELQKIITGKDEAIYAFTREKDGDKVVVVINLSAELQTFKLNGDTHEGSYTDLFSGETVELTADQSMELTPWAYKVYHQE